MSTYYFHDGRNELGPFSLDLLKKQNLSRNTPIRQKDTDSWMPAEKLAELKELVAPRKIRRPKDIVPVVLDRALSFRQRRPRTMYALLFCIALLAGFSIYSISKPIKNNTAQKQLPTPPTPVRHNSLLPVAGVEEKKIFKEELPKEDKEKNTRVRWTKLISATNSSYGIGFLGGIKDLKIIVTNRSDYPIDEAVAKVSYIKGNGSIWKIKLVTIYGVPAHDSKEQSLPDVGRGKKVTVSFNKIVSKKMKFSYTAGKKIVNPEDPYFKE